MPTPRSPDSDRRSAERKEAERLYLESKGSMKLVEIAEKMKLPDNKIRKWKSLDGWEAKLHPVVEKKSKKKPVERSTSEKGSVPHKRGAPKGNQNAKGSSGNPNPKKRISPDAAIKHGGYTAVFMDVLDEDERKLIEAIPEDTELQLMEQIQLFSIRERRILKAINKYREQKGDVSVANVTKFEEKKVVKDRAIPVNCNIETHTTNKDMIIARLEQELSTVQSKKTKAIEALAKYRMEKEKLESESAGNAAVDDWIAAVLGEGVKDHE